MPRYEPKALPQYTGLGKVIAFVSLLGGVLAVLLGLLVGIVAPSWPLYYRIAIGVIIAMPVAYVSAGRLWPADTDRLVRLRRFRGW